MKPMPDVVCRVGSNVLALLLLIGGMTAVFGVTGFAMLGLGALLSERTKLITVAVLGVLVGLGLVIAIGGFTWEMSKPLYTKCKRYWHRDPSERR